MNYTLSDELDVISHKDDRNMPPKIPPPPTPVFYNNSCSPDPLSEVEHIYEDIDRIHDPAYSYAWTVSPITLLKSKIDVCLGLDISSYSNFSGRSEKLDQDVNQRKGHRVRFQRSSPDRSLKSQLKRECLSLDDISIFGMNDPICVDSCSNSATTGFY